MADDAVLTAGANITLTHDDVADTLTIAATGTVGPQGPQGPTGPAGPAGADGTTGSYSDYMFSGTTTAPPGSGQIRLNNSTQASATQVFIHNLTSPGVDIRRIIGTMVSGSRLLIQDKDDSSKYIEFRLSGAPVDNTTYWTLPVTFVAAASALTESRVLVYFTSISSTTATTSSAGVVELATDAEVRSAAAGAVAITAAHVETAAAAVGLTDAATVVVDWDAAINFDLTVAASRIIGNPTNGQPRTYRTILVQGNDATARTVTFGNQYLGAVPTITDCTNGKWYLLTIMCISATHFVVTSVQAK